MKIKHDDIIPEKEKPFDKCKLGREKYANVLTNIVGTYADGFVLAINNEWGTGKTTFVKMWQQHLINQEYQTLYFNAWENDFDSNPLVALMAELNTLTKDKTKELFNSLLDKGAILANNILPAILKAIAAKYIDAKIIQDAIENTTKAATKILDDEIKEYTSKKEGLKEFKVKLAEFVEKTKGDKPIIFIIDELDRCRPDYAVEVLEQIKHFFSVKGIVFVLSIDKIQLGHAVRGFYGSENIDADEYLRRFIDLEYTMAEPDTKVFCEYLYGYFGFGMFLNNPKRIASSELRDDPALLIAVASKMFNHANSPLRQQEKVFAHARIVLNSFQQNQYIFPILLIVLIIIKMLHHDVYLKIKNRKLTMEELLTEYAKIVPHETGRYATKYFTQVEAYLLWLYSNSDPINRIKLMETDESGKDVLTVKSKYSEEQDLIHYLLNYIRTGDTPLGYLTDKIELFEVSIV